MHELIPLSAAGEWQASLAGIRHAFAHTWEGCRILGVTGSRPCLYRFVQGDVRIVCPLAERTWNGALDIATPYGFSGFVGNADRSGFPDLFRAFARERGWACGYVGLNPLLANPTYLDPREVCRTGTLYVLDLAPGPEELFARLAENRRREVRSFGRDGAELTTDRRRLADFFAARGPAFFRERGAGPAYCFPAAAWRALLELDSALALGAEREGRIEAATVFGWTSHAADFLFNVSLPEGRRHSAALLWQGILALRELGVPSLNLGGGIRPGDGVARFKQRFGGREVPLLAAKQVYDGAAYARLCRQAGVDPDTRDGYFPPFRDPQSAPVQAEL